MTLRDVRLAPSPRSTVMCVDSNLTAGLHHDGESRSEESEMWWQCGKTHQKRLRGYTESRNNCGEIFPSAMLHRSVIKVNTLPSIHYRKQINGYNLHLVCLD